jgi:hypothetical protein
MALCYATPTQQASEYMSFIRHLKMGQLLRMAKAVTQPRQPA